MGVICPPLNLNDLEAAALIQPNTWLQDPVACYRHIFNLLNYVLQTKLLKAHEG